MVRAELPEKLMTKADKSGSHEPTMLSDTDIVSKSIGASVRSLSDAELTAVSGGVNTQTKTPGGGFPIGVIYKPFPIHR